MAARKKKPPSYLFHSSSGQARVIIPGRDPPAVYLGTYGSPESHAEYQRIIAEWSAGSLSNGASAPAPTIGEVLSQFLAYTESYYRHPKDHVDAGRWTSEVHCYRSALRFVRELYQDLPIDQFGPLQLKAVVKRMIEAGWVRNSINLHTFRIRAFIGWAESEGKTPRGSKQSLETVPGLRSGKTSAPEKIKKKPVPADAIGAIRDYVPEVVWDMVQLQRLTGMRPGEVCRMRLAEIERNAADVKVWFYVVFFKKKNRYIALGPKCQQIIAKYMTADPQAWFFRNPAARSRHRFSTERYRRVIQRGCRLAKIGRWQPHRLRHTAGTTVADMYGEEAAQSVLGHSSSDTTRTYYIEQKLRLTPELRKVAEIAAALA